MRVAIIGYGRMGRTVETVAKQMGHEVVAQIDGSHGWELIERANPDVAIEFSVPDAVLENIRRASELGIDLAVGTTGWFDRLDQARAMVDAAGVGLIYAPNFSLGVNLFLRVVRETARRLNALPDYDLYISETHHRHKLDHPSGTAIQLAEMVLSELERKTRWTDRLEPGAVPAEVVQVASIRGGENPGTHTVGIEGPDDRIELRHESLGRSGFARGAVWAAEWIRGRKGVYTMEDLLEDRFDSGSPSSSESPEGDRE